MSTLANPTCPRLVEGYATLVGAKPTHLRLLQPYGAWPEESLTDLASDLPYEHLVSVSVRVGGDSDVVVRIQAQVGRDGNQLTLHGEALRKWLRKWSRQHGRSTEFRYVIGLKGDGLKRVTLLLDYETWQERPRARLRRVFKAFTRRPKPQPKALESADVVNREHEAEEVVDAGDLVSEAVDRHLEGIVGCDDLRQKLLEIGYMAAAFTKHQAAAGQRPSQTLHAAFVGPAGTGKTEAANRVAAFLHEMGVTKRPDAVVVHARDLVAKHIGHTHKTVQAVIESARGGVLFIDEAYALVNLEAPRDFGHEAVATLLVELESKRDDLIVIFAGYPKEMEKFLGSNPGLRSRIPTKVQFRKFTPAEAAAMLSEFARRDAVLVDAEVEDTFVFLSSLFEIPRTGRDVRNYYQRLLAGPVARRHMRIGGQMCLCEADLAEILLPLQKAVTARFVDPSSGSEPN